MSNNIFKSGLHNAELKGQDRLSSIRSNTKLEHERFLKKLHDKSQHDDEKYRQHSEQSPAQFSQASQKSLSASQQNSSSHQLAPETKKQSSHMISWSVMLDYRTIAIINALEKLYSCKNRDEVIHMLFYHNLKHLINAKGDAGRKHFELYRKVYLLTTKGKAMKRYRKFYQK